MKRILSFLIDFGIGIILVLILIYFMLNYFRGRIDLTRITNLQFNIFFGILGHLILFALTSLPAALFGKTLGQEIAGIRIVRNKDSARISISQSIILYFSFILVSVLLTFGIGILIIVLRKDRRGLHNLLSKTKVIEIMRICPRPTQKLTGGE